MSSSHVESVSCGVYLVLPALLTLISLLQLSMHSSTLANRKVEEEWSKAEQDIATRQREDQLHEQLQEEQYPTRRPIHRFFVFISVITGCSAFFMGVGQLIGIMFQMAGPIQYVLRLYVTVLCLLVILVELEWTKFARDSMIFNVWITRGICICFIGVLGLEENDTSASKNSDHPGFSATETYVKAVAWLMIACGALYFAMGICCLQLVYKRVRNDYQERLARAPNVRRAVETYGSSEGSV